MRELTWQINKRVEDILAIKQQEGNGSNLSIGLKEKRNQETQEIRNSGIGSLQINKHQTRISHLDQKENYTEVTYEDGSKFRGQFINGKKYGKGVLVDAQGNIYEGNLNRRF